MSKEELVKAIKENKIKLFLDRSKDRHYLYDEKFPHKFTGGEFSKWIDSRGTEKGDPFIELTAIKVIGVEKESGISEATPSSEVKSDREDDSTEDEEDDPAVANQGTENPRTTKVVSDVKDTSNVAVNESGDKVGKADATTEKAQATEATSDKTEKGVLNVKIKSTGYFYDRYGNKDFSAPHSVGGDYMDVCGYFDLKALNGDKSIGSIPSKIVPYDSYRTVYELADELEAIKGYKGAYYSKVDSFGHTTHIEIKIEKS
ncbi:hypothetical protein ACGCUP_00215 [Eubacteriales bacterium KG125]